MKEHSTGFLSHFPPVPLPCPPPPTGYIHTRPILPRCRPGSIPVSVQFSMVRQECRSHIIEIIPRTTTLYLEMPQRRLRGVAHDVANVGRVGASNIESEKSHKKLPTHPDMIGSPNWRGKNGNHQKKKKGGSHQQNLTDSMMLGG